MNRKRLVMQEIICFLMRESALLRFQIQICIIISESRIINFRWYSNTIFTVQEVIDAINATSIASAEALLGTTLSDTIIFGSSLRSHVSNFGEQEIDFGRIMADCQLWIFLLN